MSDYCRSCAFDPKTTCPLTRMYWAFLERHEEELSGNPRMKLPVLSASRRSKSDRDLDRETFERARDLLGEGRRLVPEAFDDLAR